MQTRQRRAAHPLRSIVPSTRYRLVRTSALICLALGCAMPASAWAQACEPVKTRTSRAGVTGHVIPSAKHCLNENLRQTKEFDIHAMRFLSYGGKPLLSIFCAYGETCTRAPGAPMIDIDLRERRLKADVDDMVGVKDWVASERIFLHDGTVIVPGTRAANVGVDLQSMTSAYKTYARLDCRQSRADCGNGQVASISREAPPYEATRHIVQRIRIRAGWLGVQMVGIGNALRNSVIEVDSRHAVALFGFGSIIENNTTIVHGEGTPAADDGAIALWDGNGAVIRNNRFIYKGRAKHAPPAIRLIDSAGVILEGNTFEGFGQAVAQTGISSYSDKQ